MFHHNYHWPCSHKKYVPSVVYNMGLLKHFAPWVIFLPRVLTHFEREKYVWVLLSQNVSIPHIVYYNPSVKIGSISFFSSSDMQKSHHLLGYHTIGIMIGINYAFNFFNFFAFFKSNMPSQKSCLDWKLKQYAWQKSYPD